MRYKIEYDILNKDAKINRKFWWITEASSKCIAIDKMIDVMFGKKFFFLQTFEFSGIGQYGSIFEKENFPQKVNPIPICKICINASEI